MPSVKISKVTKVTKLVVGDAGFNPSEDTFEVEAEPPKSHVTLPRLTARIADLEQRKADEIEKWDEQIDMLNELKDQIESA